MRHIGLIHEKAFKFNCFTFCIPYSSHSGVLNKNCISLKCDDDIHNKGNDMLSLSVHSPSPWPCTSSREETAQQTDVYHQI